MICWCKEDNASEKVDKGTKRNFEIIKVKTRNYESQRKNR